MPAQGFEVVEETHFGFGVVDSFFAQHGANVGEERKNETGGRFLNERMGSLETQSKREGFPSCYCFGIVWGGWQM